MKIHHLAMRQEFNAPVEKIWETFSNLDSFARMMGQSMTRIKDSSDPTNLNGVGSVRRINLPLIPFEETILKSEKPSGIEYQITKNSPLTHHYGTMVFTSIPGGKSRIDYTIELGSVIPGWAGMVKILLRSAIERSMRKYASRLNADAN